MPNATAFLFAVAITVLATLWGCRSRQALIDEASRSRFAAQGCRLRRARLDLLAEHSRVKGSRAELQAKLTRRLVQAKRARLRMLLRQLDALQGQALASRSHAQYGGPSGALTVRSSWHAIAPDGTCPAAVPQWEWGSLLRAALADAPHERAVALGELRSSSRLPLGELHELAARYRQVLDNREFDGILDVAHPSCGGRRFAWLEGDRLLTIDCPGGGASYAIDERAELYEYVRPLRVGRGEAILAFCGAELNLLLHPQLRPELLPGGGGGEGGGEGGGSGGGGGWEFEGDPFGQSRPAETLIRVEAPRGPRVPSVLVFMIDATSRAHFRRSLPKTLATLERLAGGGAPTGASAQGASAGAPADSPDASERLHVFDFEHYNVVGYNSVPNQLPLFCNLSPDALSSLQPGRCVWEAFKRRGAVTLVADEVHDNCESPTSVLHAIRQSAYWMGEREQPDHQLWRLFCSPHVKPCCWAAGGFLNPGRRQCVGGGRELHQVVVGYLEQWLHMYAAAPRRFAMVNTMVAHEHFMLRLPSLDETLSGLLERLASSTLQETVLFLLSDHGTHGIWYNDYEIGAAEHKLPFFYMVAPDWLLRQRPGWLEALRANQRRLVTVREVYAAMRELAAFPEPESHEAGLRSLFEHLPEHRSCADAGIPEQFCACRRVEG